MFTSHPVRHVNSERHSICPLSTNCEREINFDEDVPLRQILSSLRTGLKKYYWFLIFWSTMGFSICCVVDELFCYIQVG